MNLESLRAVGHYLDQKNVVRKAGNKVYAVGLGGLGALMGYDVWKSPSDERGKVLLRDACVLGSTAAGTALAVRQWMPLPKPHEIAEEMTGFLEKLKEVEEHFPGLSRLALDRQGKLKDALKVEDFRKIIRTIREQGALPKEKREALLDKLLPIGDSEPLEGEGFFGIMKAIPKKMFKIEANGERSGEGWKMVDFFRVGLASVASGLGGGLLANRLNGVRDRNASVNMIKEGVFQFIANIALCAVGASLGLIATEIPAVSRKLAKMGGAAKLARVSIITSGLSLGILGGGKIANELGRRFVNPVFDRIQGKNPDPSKPPEKRKVEFADAILHLDDLPTALALAGMEIMEPFIPLFFVFSGYRTGIGYRNNQTGKQAGPPSDRHADQASLPSANRTPSHVETTHRRQQDVRPATTPLSPSGMYPPNGNTFGRTPAGFSLPLTGTHAKPYPFPPVRTLS